MQGYSIRFLNQLWESEFEFTESPAIEVIFDDNVIYEKPHFDFKAYGDLFTAIQDKQQQVTCGNEDIIVYREGEVIWTGLVRISDINNVFHESGNCYKEVEVIDNNYNAWFLNFDSTEIQMDIAYDLECERTSIPSQTTYTLFNPSTPATTYERDGYNVYDVVRHLVKLITRNNVTVQSDFFTSGDGQYLAIFNGDQLGNDEPFDALKISYKDLIDDLNKAYNLTIRHYTSGGVNYVRIEQYSYYYSGEALLYDYVSNVRHSTKLDKLFSLARIGDANKIDESFTTVFVPFEFSSFDEQKVNVGQDCSSGSELSLSLQNLIVNTDKIHFQVVNGSTDTTYRDSLFLVECNEDDEAIVYTRAGVSYYNDSLTNGKILARYFDGSAPITVFPDSYDDINYWSVTTDELKGAGSPVLSATPQTLILGQLWYPHDIEYYDSDNTVDTTTKTNQINATAVGTEDAFRWTCSKTATYKISANFRVGTTVALAILPPSERVKLRLNIRHEDNGGSLINLYSSEYIEAHDSKANLTYETPNITVSSTDKVFAYLNSNTLNNVGGGTVDYLIYSGSSLSVLGCPNFVSQYSSDTFKNMIYKTVFDNYPMTKETFDTIRANPGIKNRVVTKNHNTYYINGYIDSLKYDYDKRIANVSLKGNEIYTP